MVVYVLDIAGKPLMPTRRFDNVRRMLRNGKAIVVNLEPFVIQLMYETTHYTQEITLGVDAGSIHVGLSATTKRNELYAAEVDLRSKDVKKLKDSQREYRRSRRNRLRHSKPRFNNRKKCESWLAPSMQHRIDSHIRIIDSVCKILPITKIIVEVGLFDTQKISNPEISGVEYQNGQMKDYDNTKAFVKSRDNYTCQNCKGKSGDTRLEVHHIIHRNDGGSDRPDNLITLCHTCHYDYHNNGLKLKKFSNLNKKNADSLRDCAAMNIIKDRVYEELLKKYPDRIIWRTYGCVTAHNRREYAIDKSHTNDAFVISKNFNAIPLDYYLAGRQIRRHNRQIHKAKICKGGILKKNQASHSVFNFHYMDRVIFNNTVCFVFGRRTSGYFDLRDIKGNKIHASASYKKIKLVRHEKNIIFDKIKKACADSSSDAKDVAVSSAYLL